LMVASIDPEASRPSGSAACRVAAPATLPTGCRRAESRQAEGTLRSASVSPTDPGSAPEWPPATGLWPASRSCHPPGGSRHRDGGCSHRASPGWGCRRR
jgi:hypothetical protein